MADAYWWGRWQASPPQLFSATQASIKVGDAKITPANSQTYGIHLNDMVVLDIDADEADLIDEMGPLRANDCIVRTGRGFHLYYSTINKVTLSAPLVCR